MKNGLIGCASIFFRLRKRKDHDSTWIIMISDHPESEKDYGAAVNSFFIILAYSFARYSTARNIRITPKESP